MKIDFGIDDQAEQFWNFIVGDETEFHDVMARGLFHTMLPKLNVLFEKFNMNSIIIDDFSYHMFSFQYIDYDVVIVYNAIGDPDMVSFDCIKYYN